MSLLTRFWEKYVTDGRSMEFFQSMFSSPHAEIAAITDNESGEPIAGHVYLSFLELGFAFSDVLAGDTDTLRQNMWQDSRPDPEVVYSMTELPGSEQLLDDLWYISPRRVDPKDAATALYLYWQIAHGIDNPLDDPAYLERAQKLYEM